MTPAVVRAAQSLACALLAVIGLAVLSVAGTSDSYAHAPASTTSAEDAFGSCVNGSRVADLVLLVDESGSLGKTDPRAARVKAARYLVDRLAGYADAARISLAVNVAGFADEYRTVRGWTALTSSSSGNVDNALGSLANRNTGFETDYWTALDGARKTLAARQDHDGSHCQAIVWFTDGELAISPRTSAGERKRYGTDKPYYGSKVTSERAASAAKRAATRDICRSGGLADSLRTDKVWTFAVGLQPPGATQNFSLLRRIATGSAPGQPRCGAISSPTPGSFQLASDIDGLLFAFDSITAPGQPTINSNARVCQRVACRDQHAFVLDASIRSVHILATSGVTSAVVTLVTPSGTSVTLRKSSAESQKITDGITIRWRWISDKSLEIDMNQPDSAARWAGQWALLFVDPTGNSPDAISRSDVHIQSDITATWPSARTTTLRAGSTARNVRLGLARTNGQAVDPRSLRGSVSLSAQLIGPNGTLLGTVAEGLNATTLTAPQVLDLRRVQPGRAKLRLVLTITTAAARLSGGRTISGTTLSPQTTDVPLTIDEPLNYPKLATAINFGDITGPANATASVQVRGPGCVWLSQGGRALTAPQGIGRVQLTAKARARSTCRSVDSGASVSIPVTLHTARQGSGEIKGEATFVLIAKDTSARPITVTVPFRADLAKKLNTFDFWLAFVIALVLGLGIPVALLYAAKWFEARVPAGTLLAERFSAIVTPSDVVRDGIPLSLRDKDFVQNLTAVPAPARSITVAGLELRAVVTILPGKACDVVVEAPGRIGVTSGRGTASDGKLRARLPLAVRDHWVLLHDPTGPADAADLLVIVGDDTSPARRAELMEDARQNLPGALARLRTAATESGILAESAPAAAPVGAFPGGNDFPRSPDGDFPPGPGEFPSGPGGYPSGAGSGFPGSAPPDGSFPGGAPPGGAPGEQPPDFPDFPSGPPVR